MSDLQLSNEEKLKRIIKVRQRCRTDLLFLATKILNYKDCDTAFHGEWIEQLQKFRGGTDNFDPQGNFISYTPACPVYELEGSRRNLYLAFRSSFKTTIFTVAHTVQWIINYPDIRVLICHSVNSVAEDILSEVKQHFAYNESFRALFMEHCPAPKRASDFGNQQEFTTLARKVIKKEPTVQACSVESTTAGTHTEVIKCSDIVNKENVRTPEAMRQIRRSVAQLQFLLDQPALGWLDVEGTLYDYSDVYNDILRAEEKRKPGDTRIWNIFRKPILDEAGNPAWPGRFNQERIAAIRNDPTMTTYDYMSQYMLRIVSGENQYFQAEDFQWTPPDIIAQNCNRYHMTVDLCSPDPIHGPSKTEDFTVITVAGFDRMNRMYVCDMSRGRYLPDETINEIFRLYEKYGETTDVKMEDASGARQILPFLDREKVKRNSWPIVTLIPRDNRTSKQDRIAGLQPWFKARDIRFANDLPWKEEMLTEFCYFPRYNHDDICDTIADQMQNRYTGPYGKEEQLPEEPKEIEMPWYYGKQDSMDYEYIDRTGR